MDIISTRLNEERIAYEEEIEGLKAEVERLREENANQTYLGNSVEHWYTKAKCYGDMVHGCAPTLERAGFPVDRFSKDGAVGGIARAVEAMQAEMEQLRGYLADIRQESEDCDLKSLVMICDEALEGE